MKILVSGSNGLVGKALVIKLRSEGHQVFRLVRRNTGQSDEIFWNPGSGQIELAKLEGFDSVIHLAGESIAEGRWNDAKKERIRSTRIEGTHNLAKNLSQLKNPPKNFLVASAIGFYGDRGQEIMTESNTPGQGFLPYVCIDWEKAADPAREKGIPVSHLRFGIILSQDGGALQKMLFPFKMGVGGKIGSGEQYMSWISLADTIAAIIFVMKTATIKGAVNVVAPYAVTNGEFTKTLGKVLGRPTIFPMPAFAAKLAFGEMAEALLLASTRVEPSVLLKNGFKFSTERLESALTTILLK